MRAECGVEREGYLRHAFRRVDRAKELAYPRLGRLDEAEEAVWLPLVVTAPDPQRKSVVADRNEPTPILGSGRAAPQPLSVERTAQVVSELFAPASGIDLFVLARLGRERVR